MTMFRLPVTLAGPLNVTGQIVSAAIPKPVDSFPTSVYADPFEATSANANKLQAALNAAVSKEVKKDGKGPFGLIGKVPFTIADVTTKTPKFPVGKTSGADNNADLSYFIASEDKVSVMYAAYEMRAMARRFQAANSGIPPDQLFAAMKSVQTPIFLHGVPLLEAKPTGAGFQNQITDADRQPNYAAVFAPPAAGALIDFENAKFKLALAKMVVESADAPETVTMIGGIGYSYLNGALRAGGFFNGTDGAWVGSNYGGGRLARVIHSQNDGPATLTGSAYQMAKMMALIHIATLVDTGATSATINGGAGANGGTGSSVKWRQCCEPRSRPSPVLRTNASHKQCRIFL